MPSPMGSRGCRYRSGRDDSNARKDSRSHCGLGINLGEQLLAPPESGQLCSDFMAQPPLVQILMRPRPLDYYDDYHQFHFSVIEVTSWGGVGGIGGGSSRGGPAGI